MKLRLLVTCLVTGIALHTHGAEKPDLPRVLIIGDSVSIGYTKPLAQILKGTAVVVHNPGNATHSGHGLAKLDSWLGDTKWDVIHFNHGLHDLKYVDDKGKNSDTKANAHIQTPLEAYRKNMEAIVTRLKKTGAKLIFATTTPYPSGVKPLRIPEDVRRYNTVALEVMKQEGVVVDDLYSFILPQREKLQRPTNVHFTEAGYVALAQEVARHIQEALGQGAPTAPLSAVQDAETRVSLPPVAQEQKDALSGLFALVKSGTYPVEWRKQVNSGERRVRSITIATNPRAVNGVVQVKVPPPLARAWSLFSKCTIRGKGLGSIKAAVLLDDGTRQPMKTVSSRDAVYSGKIRHIKLGDGWTHTTLEVRGTGEIHAIDFQSDHGISPVFDDRAWRVLGGDKPILPVQVKLSATTRRGIDGITNLELDKFRRLYCSINGEPEQWEALEYFKAKGFMPGRQMLKFGPTLEKAHGDASAPKLTEDPDRPGWSEYSFFKNAYQPDRTLIKKLKKTYPPDFEYAMCLNFWPSWMEPRNLKIRNPKGTPAIELFDAAADLAARYIEAQKRKTGRIAKYWEVKNESDIKSEWIYHGEKDYDGWKLLADFHNKVATAIKSRTPTVKVGGPTSAWPMLDANGENGFGRALDHLTFMDRTRDSLDFYSLHFYESRCLIINDPDSEKNYGGFLGGRLEATLDLLRNHMLLTDNLKPLIISETGTLMAAPDEVSHWIKLKNYNSFMVRYMNRANEFRMIVPFLLPVTWWAKNANDTIFAYQPDGSLALTKQHFYLDFWQDYRGDLIVAETTTPKVFLHAVYDDKTVRLVINNMNPQRVSVDIEPELGDARIESIEQKRLWLDRGALRFETTPLKGLKNIPLSVEETSMVTIRLDRPVIFNSRLSEKTVYGDRTLQATGEPATFEVKCPLEQITSAKLRVSFGRNGGFSKDLTVRFNGDTYRQDLGYTDKSGRFFGYAEFEIPPELIKERNTVVVHIPQKGGKISTVAIAYKVRQALAGQ